MHLITTERMIVILVVIGLITALFPGMDAVIIKLLIAAAVIVFVFWLLSFFNGFRPGK